MKHWTTEICDKHLAEGYKFTIFDRRGKGDNMSAPCNTYGEMFEILDKRYPSMDFTDRLALLPSSETSNREFWLMYYEDDGTKKCLGRLITNAEPDDDLKPRTGYDNTDAGVVNVTKP